MSPIRLSASPARHAHRFATIALAISAILLTGMAPAIAQDAPRRDPPGDVRTVKSNALVDSFMQLGLSRASAEQLAARMIAGDEDAKKTDATLQQMAARLQAGRVSRETQSAVLEEAARRRLVDAAQGGVADQLVRRALADERSKAPPGGPASPVAIPSVRADVTAVRPAGTAKENIVSRSAEMPSAAVRGQLATALADSAAARPGFDQGAKARPTISEADAARVRGNPMSRETGGQVVGGPLGAAAAGATTGPGRAGAAASGLVSAGGITTPVTSGADGVSGVGTRVRDAYAGTGAQGTADLISSNTDKTNKGKMTQYALCAANDCPPPIDPVATAVDTSTRVVNHPSGTTSTHVGGGSSQPGGTTTWTSARDSQGRATKETVVTNNKDGTRTVTKRETTYSDDNDAVGTAVTTATVTGMCPQDAEGCGARPTEEDMRRRTADRNFQIVQQAKAGAAINPDRNDGLSARSTNAVIAADAHSQLGQRLLGQPGPAGVGLNDGGSGSGPAIADRNRNAINPGRDAVHAGGTGPESNRANDALNSRVTEPSVLSPASSDAEDEDEDDGGTAPR